MYVENAVVLEVVFAFMEELRFDSVNLRMKKRLDAILLATKDTRHRINQLH